jgi:hypothetical protein
MTVESGDVPPAHFGGFRASALPREDKNETTLKGAGGSILTRRADKSRRLFSGDFEISGIP